MQLQQLPITRAGWDYERGWLSSSLTLMSLPQNLHVEVISHLADDLEAQYSSKCVSKYFNSFKQLLSPSSFFEPGIREDLLTQLEMHATWFKRDTSKVQVSQIPSSLIL